MRSTGQRELAKPGNSSSLPYAPQRVTGLDEDDDDDDDDDDDLAVPEKLIK